MLKFQSLHLKEDTFGTPEYSAPTPDKIVDGKPSFKTWLMSNPPENVLAAGVWEATPGAWQSAKGHTSEFFTILAGISEFTEENGAVVRFQTGDTFIMRPGCTGVWRVIEKTRKSFVTFAS
ncbi:MAG: cupin domain-containing protein [Parvibaculaceae bacterium]